MRSEPKTKASARTIALPPVLFRALTKHKDRQGCERAEQGEQWKDSGYVFTSTIGTPCEPAKILKRFKAALTEAELPDTIRLHDLRHSCATFLIEQGEHPRVVMEILGHSQIATTMNIYGHVFPHTQRDALLGIDELFNDEQEQGEGEDETKE